MPSLSLETQLLFSDLSRDPDLVDLVALFVGELPERVRTLEELLASRDWQGLRRAAHQIKGAAGSYGFPAISAVAAALESAAGQPAPEDEIRVCFEELTTLCLRARAGVPE